MEARLRLARSLTAALRRAAGVRAAAVAACVAAGGLILVEIAARAVALPPPRTFAPGLAIAAAVAGAAAYLRLRPDADAWRDVADREGPAPGVFRASATGATRLSPLVAAMAEEAATALLARPGRRERLPSIARAATLLACVAVAVASLPGRRAPTNVLDDALRTRLRDDVVRAAAATADDHGLARAARDLSATTISREAAAAIAHEIERARREAEARSTPVLSGLETDPALRDLAAALRDGDPAALDRAIAALTRALREAPPRSDASLATAAALLRAAAAETDERVRSALEDAARAVQTWSDASGAAAMTGLGAALHRRLSASAALKDAVVTLRSAAAPDTGGAPALRTKRSLRDVSDTRDGGLPVSALPAGATALARPQTADAQVLERYFALR